MFVRWPLALGNASSNKQHLRLPGLLLLLLLLCSLCGAALQQAAAVGDDPVWRQVLRYHLDHNDPEVAQQAAAALAE